MLPDKTPLSGGSRRKKALQIRSWKEATKPGPMKHTNEQFSWERTLPTTLKGRGVRNRAEKQIQTRHIEVRIDKKLQRCHFDNL